MEQWFGQIYSVSFDLSRGLYTIWAVFTVMMSMRNDIQTKEFALAFRSEEINISVDLCWERCERKTYMKLLNICLVSSDDLELAKLMNEQ
jgi:hypothetical protein